MILAAGYGTRMKPVTDQIPKALIPLFNIPLIDWKIETLISADIVDIAINIHHQSELLKTHLEEKYSHLNLFYSIEEPNILGSGGGIKNVENFFKNEADFIVLNCDVIVDFNLADIIKAHQTINPLATLLVRKNLEDYTGFDVDKNKFILSFKKDGPYMFCGIQVINLKIFKFLENTFSCIINDGYETALKKNEKIYTQELKTQWIDFGTIELYLNNHFSILKDLKNNGFLLSQLKKFHPELIEAKPGVWMTSKSDINLDQIEAPAFIGNNVTIEKGAKLGSNIVLGNNVKIEKNSEIKNSIVFNGKVIKENTKIENQVFS